MKFHRTAIDRGIRRPHLPGMATLLPGTKHMAEDSNPSMLIVLCQGSNGSRVAVDLESFLRFNAQQDQDLQNLVDRWSDYATPRSRRNWSRRFRS